MWVLIGGDFKSNLQVFLQIILVLDSQEKSKLT